MVMHRMLHNNNDNNNDYDNDNNGRLWLARRALWPSPYVSSLVCCRPPLAGRPPVAGLARHGASLLAACG
jgi:hypothetical protein